MLVVILLIFMGILFVFCAVYNKAWGYLVGTAVCAVGIVLAMTRYPT
jgi:hypothetical protein